MDNPKNSVTTHRSLFQCPGCDKDVSGSVMYEVNPNAEFSSAQLRCVGALVKHDCRPKMPMTRG